MILKQLKLFNFGPYKETDNSIDFDVSKEKNIILIGGNNGAGKTTILEAIKLCFFGSYSLGFKTENNTYYDYLWSKFNYQAIASNDENKTFKIELTYIDHNDYQETTYTLTRQWKINGTIEEFFNVIKKTKYDENELPQELTPSEIVVFQDNLRSKMPVSVFNSFVFDGEKIGRIIDDNHIKEYIKEVFESVFNIDLFDSLNSDLISYLSAEVRSETKNTHELELMKCVVEEKELALSIRNYNTMLETYEQSIRNVEEEEKALLRKIELISGIPTSLAKQLKIEFNEALKENDATNKDVRKFLDSTYIFYKNRDLLSMVESQIQREQPMELKMQLLRLNDYLASKHESENHLPQNHIETTIELLNTDAKGIKNLHHGNISLLDKVKNTISASMDEQKKVLEKLFKSNSKKLKLNKSKFAILENSTQIEEIFAEIKNNRETYNDFAERIQQTILKRNDLKTAQININERIYDLNEKIRINDKFNSSLQYSKRIIDVSTEIKAQLTKKRLSAVSDNLSIFFAQVVRKEKYIKAIKLNENYELSLFDYNDVEMKISMLSAGEKQLLMASAIFVMFKLSNRRVPFIFDTPMARLDKENRNNFVDKILKPISEQVIILSTNEEIVDNVFEQLKDTVSEVILLEYNVKKRSTKVNKGEYF